MRNFVPLHRIKTLLAAYAEKFLQGIGRYRGDAIEAWFCRVRQIAMAMRILRPVAIRSDQNSTNRDIRRLFHVSLCGTDTP